MNDLKEEIGKETESERGLDLIKELSYARIGLDVESKV